LIINVKNVQNINYIFVKIIIKINNKNNNTMSNLKGNIIGLIKKLKLSKIINEQLSDIQISKKLGDNIYIRNGVGFGFISDEELYDNCWLELGFGEIMSGYGDWGFGVSYTTDTPLKITIDKNYVIQKISTSSFYNSDKSQMIEEDAKKLINKIKVGDKLNIKREDLSKALNIIFNILPVKNYIGHTVSRTHMLKHYKEIDFGQYYSFRNSKCV